MVCHEACPLECEGLGGVDNRVAVRELFLKLSPDIVFLQESKLESFDNFSVASMWEARFKDWVILPSYRASKGIIVM